MAKAKPSRTDTKAKAGIELRPHTGIDRAGRELTFDQDQIFSKGVRLGYVGHQPGTTVCLIVPVDAKTLAEIHKAIEAKFGKPPKGTLTAPVIPESSDE